MKLKQFAASSAACFGLIGSSQALEYGNLDVVQLNNTNNNLDVENPAVSVTIAPGSSPNFGFFNANRGDIAVHFGTEDDPANGAMITAVRENGRNNVAGGDADIIEYVTALGEVGWGGDPTRYFIPLETAPGSQEWNINCAAAYFPFNEGWLAGHTATSTGNNGGVQDLVTAAPGISFGSTFVDEGRGVFALDLTGLTSFGTTATSQNGVLLTTGQKNEDNFALSQDNADGTFTIILKDNGVPGERSERDPIAFAYVPTSLAGPNLVTAVGRVQSDGSSEISGGDYTVTKLRGPADGTDPVGAVATTATIEANTSFATTADTTDASADIVVADATDIETGMAVEGDGIPPGVTVAAVSGTTVTLSEPAIATASGVAVTFTTTTADELTIAVADATGIETGMILEGDGIAAGTVVESITGTDIGLSQAVTAGGTDVAVTFATPGRWLLEIVGQSENTGTLILTPCTGGPNNRDNIVSYEWDGALGTAGGWVVESRDIVGGSNRPVLEDGATPDEDMFNFTFFTVEPANAQPVVSVTAPTDGAVIGVDNSVTITADASDADGTIAQVEFRLNGTVASTDDTAPYSYTTPVFSEPTNAVVEVVAVDDGGARTVSEPVLFSIVPPGGSGGLFFNGIDDYVDLGDPAELNLATFTLETRFRRAGAGEAASTGVGGVTAIPLVTKGRGEDDQSNRDLNYFLGIRESDGVLVADFEDANLGTNSPVIGRTPVDLNEWHHAAATFDGTRWSLYLDGNLEATLEVGGLIPRADSIQPAALASALNSLGEPAGFFHGFLDETRIWDRALTQSEIRERLEFEIAAEDGLVARWAMTEGSGSTITSTATGALEGTLIDNPAWVAGATFDENIRPDVTVTGPAEGARFIFGDAIPLTASAADPDGTIAEVRFFDGGSLIGSDTAEPFEFSYTDAPLGGRREIRAEAIDNDGGRSLSEAVVIDVTLPAPALPGYSQGVVDGGDVDADSGTAPQDPANWAYELATASPLALDSPGTNTGDLEIRIDGTSVPFDSGFLMATNFASSDNNAAIDNILSPFADENGNYFLSSIDNGGPGESNPSTTKESSRLSLGFFPYADGWVGANFEADATILSGNSNLPAGVTVTNVENGVYGISGLPITGNLIATTTDNGTDNVTSVGRSGDDWVIISRDNSQSVQSASFGLLYVPTSTRQVFSGRILDDGTLEPLNEELEQIGANVNVGTQGYEVTIGDGRIINPSNSVMFVVADFDAGFAGDNIMSYSAVGNSFVVFSQDLPGLNSQFQSGGFRFLIAPIDPVTRVGDEVFIIAEDASAVENSDDNLNFRITRTGDTAEALTVNYGVGGSATPGSDFDTLPGTATIPAGAVSVDIPVSALGDTELELDEDVILTLAPSADYTVGRFDEARGIIADAPPVVPSTTLAFQEGVDGYTGQWGKRIGENGANQLGSDVVDYFLDGRPGSYNQDTGSGSPDINGIVRFDHIIGDGPDQIPAGAQVTDARLIMTTSMRNYADTNGPYIIDRLLVPVDETTTWFELGIDDNNDFEGFEGVRGASTNLPVDGFGRLDKGEIGEANVTAIVQAWAEGNPNHGFSIITGGTRNGWAYNTVGNPNPALRPRLEVTFTPLDVKEYLFTANRSAILNTQSGPEGATVDGQQIESLFLDLNDPNNGTTEALFGFPVTFGSGTPGAIPVGEEVVKAELLMVTNSPIFLGSFNAQTGGEYTVHRMLDDWDAASSFGAFGPVVGTDIAPEAARFTGMGWGSTSYVDVTDIVRNWRAGAENHGVNVKPDTSDGWQPFFPGALSTLGENAVPRLRVQTAILDPSLFDTWAADNGIAGANLNEDADNDGIAELIEYALGLDPRSFDRLPGLGPDGALSFAKGADAAADPAVSYSLEVSDDLVEWTPLTPTVNDASEISGQLPESPEGGKMFGRLNVEFVPQP